MLPSNVSSLATAVWPVIWTPIGAGMGLALNWLADLLHRQNPDAPIIPRRALWLAIVTAFLFGVAAWQFGLTLRMLLTSAYVAVLILLTATDLEQRLIPSRIILPAILFALAAGFFANWMTWKAALLGGAVGLVFFSVAYAMAAVLYPGKIGLGMGDVTLATFIGLAVGFPSAVVAVVLAVLLGGLVSTLLLVTRRVTLRTAIPYGPFLVVGGLVAIFWGQAIVRWYLRM